MLKTYIPSLIGRSLRRGKMITKIFLLGTSIGISPALAQTAETTTSPIESSLTVAASVDASCAFWLGNNTVSFGAYEGDANVAITSMHFRCSVLPTGLNNNTPGNYYPTCVDAGAHFQPQTNPVDKHSPRTMLLENGDPSNDDHRLNYNIFWSTTKFPPSGSSAWGTKPNSDGICEGAVPNLRVHPGDTVGYDGASDSFNANQTYTYPIVFRIYPSDEQPGTPVTGNYSDMVTIYQVFADP